MGCFNFLSDPDPGIDRGSPLNRKRSCTDCCCGVIFLIFLVGMVIATVLLAFDECGYDTNRKTIYGESKDDRRKVNVSIILDRCIPDILVVLGKNEIKLILSEIGSSYNDALADLNIARWAIVAMCIPVCLFALLTVILIQYVSLLIWITYILSVGSLAAATGLLWYAYALRNDGMETEMETELNEYVMLLLSSVIEHDKVLLFSSVISTVFLVVLVLAIFVMRKRVAFALELFNQATQVLVAKPSLLILSLRSVPSVLLVYWAHYFIKGVSMILSINHDIITAEQNYRMDNAMKYLWGITFICHFTSCCERFVLASCVADWYFTRDKKTFSPTIMPNIGYLIRYHTGSMALGAIFVMVVHQSLIQKFHGVKSTEDASLIVHYLYSVIINVNTCIAIERKNFCFSAKRVVVILAGNCLRVSATFFVIVVVLVTNILVVVSLTTLSSVVILEMELFSIPWTAVILFASAISGLFSSTYEAIVTSLFLCFCEDDQMNDGSTEKPYFMENGLIAFVSNKACDNKPASETTEGGEVVRDLATGKEFVNNSSKANDDESKQWSASTEGEEDTIQGVEPLLKSK